MADDELSLVSGPLENASSSGPDFIEDDIKSQSSPSFAFNRRRFKRQSYDQNDESLQSSEKEGLSSDSQKVLLGVEKQDGFKQDASESPVSSELSKLWDLERKDLKDKISDRDILILEKNEIIESLEKKVLGLTDQISAYQRDFSELVQSAESSLSEERIVLFIRSFEMIHDSYVFAKGFGSTIHPVEVLAEGLLSLKTYFLDKLSEFKVSLRDPLGDYFDPVFHDVVSSSFSLDKSNGIILQTLKPLWLLDGAVYRKAQVRISRGRDKS